jgi:capsular exopolysaccharide synthesis family protein
LSQLEQSYRELIVAANEMDRSAASAQTQITIEDPAVAPTTPYAPKTKLYTILGAFAGLCLAVGGIAFFEYLDNTVKGELDFPQVFGLPMLSMIGNMPKLQPGRKQLFALNDPKSGATEAVRLLRTNLEFAAATNEIATLAITSAGPGEGKSTITANLAITMAQAGFATVIIDADLRRPSQHKIWGVANDRGLSTLLTRPDHPWRWASVNEIAPNLSLIPSGPVPPNPADLLSLERFRALIEEISHSVNVVVIDTPPVLAVSDPLIVATGVDAVAIVTHAGRTRIDALRHAISTLSQGSVRVAGVILNHSTVRDSGNYYYYAGYYGPSDESPTASSTPSKNGGLKRPDRSSGGLTAPPVSAEQ